ncbi:MAG: hypothetical protein HRT57_00415 [Crocinitomicaceae bacterium]|nr:hypothetical protein [Crocinitomicaceae bacterium]
MSNNVDLEILQSLKETLPIFGMGELYVPVENPDPADSIVFKPFGIEVEDEPFNLGCTIGSPEGSNANYLVAVTTGSIIMEQYDSTGKITLRNGDVLGNVVMSDNLPDWFPIPNYIIYDNIDVAETETILTTLLVDSPKTIEAIYKDLGTEQPADDTIAAEEIITFFMSGVLEFGIPISAGELIGKAGTGTDSDRQVGVSFQEELDNIDGFYLDPAIYFTHWEEYFNNLSGHELKDSFQKIFAGPVANGTIIYMADTGSGLAPYATALEAATSLSDAVSIAQPGDSIVIVSNQIYNAGAEIIIENPINITYLDSNHYDVLDESIAPSIVSLVGGNSHRVLRIELVESKAVMSISNVAIQDGSIGKDIGDGTYGGSYPYTGGGILIYYSDRTYIRNCIIELNSLLRRGLRFNGYGAGIGMTQSSPYIYGNQIRDNINTKGRGGGIGGFGYGWPTIESNTFKRNIAELNASGKGLPDGGAIAFLVGTPNELDHLVLSIEALAEEHRESDDPDEFLNDWIQVILDLSTQWISGELDEALNNRIRILNNTFEENRAAQNGGAAYFTALCRVEFRENSFLNNVAGFAGGAVRASFGCNLVFNGDEMIGNYANYRAIEKITSNTEEYRNGGGAIAARNSDLDLYNVKIKDNYVFGWAGGGIFFNSGDEGAFFNQAGDLARDLMVFVIVGVLESLNLEDLTDMGIDYVENNPIFDFNAILRNVYGYSEAKLKIHGMDSEVSGNQCYFLKHDQTIDRRKGAGIYCLRLFTFDDTVNYTFEGVPLNIEFDALAKIKNNGNDMELDDVTIDPENLNTLSFSVSAPADIDNPDSTDFHLLDQPEGDHVVDDVSKTDPAYHNPVTDLFFYSSGVTKH